MKFSTKTRYGIRAILEIALNNDTNGIYQKEIAQNQDISYKYLDQIMNALKVAGLVTKAAGRKRGYVLTRPPEEITVYDVHNAFEPGICVIDCLSINFSCEREKFCSLRGFWGNLNNQIIEYFKSTTIKDLMEEQVKLDDLVQARN
ncbi:MAG: RrF2 family transcriptional regulator [Mariniphaga sp.]